MKTTATVLALAALAVLPASSSAAVPSDDAPQFAAAPSVSFHIIVDRKGHFASLGAVVRLRHKLTQHQRRTFGAGGVR
jgi:hypothetical protein